MEIRRSILWGTVAVFGCLLLAFWFGDDVVRAFRGKSKPSEAPAQSSAFSEVDYSEPVAAGGLPDFLIPIPLTNILIDAENHSFLTEEAYAKMPRGEKVLGSIPFRIDGLLQLQGIASQDRQRQYRFEISVPVADAGIIATNVRSVHLLGATRYEETPDERVADVVWRYTDGTSRRVPLTYLREIRNWMRQPYEQPARLSHSFSKAVWSEPVDQSGRWRRLYRVTLPNPEPTKAIQNLELVSARRAGTLFALALTLDSYPPGARLDDSPDCEPTDSEIARQIEIVVQSTDGQPLPGALVQGIAKRAYDSSPVPQANVVTDELGIAIISYPPGQLYDYQIVATHDGFGSRSVLWQPLAGDQIPERYVLKLGEGLRIGGRVVDSAGSPIPGVRLSFGLSFDSREHRGERAALLIKPILTDAAGMWNAVGIPKELISGVTLLADHRDFISTPFSPSPADLIAMRDGRFKIILRRGVPVRGYVVDEFNRPMKNTVVQVSASNSANTRTDDEGAFKFEKVAEGEGMFTVQPPDRAAEVRHFQVRAGMADIVIRLKSPLSILGRVQNGSGEPIAEANVARVRYDHNAAGEDATTGADGKFQIDGASRGGTYYRVSAAGFQVKQVQLFPNRENVVTLRRKREIRGLVLEDATGLPLTNFVVRVGTKHFSETEMFNPRQKSYKANDGRFAVSLEDENENAIAVGVSGFSDETISVNASDIDSSEVVFRMKRDQTLTGVILKPDGTPAPRVSLALISDGGGMPRFSLGERSLAVLGPGSLERSDAEGRFEISNAREGQIIFAVGSPGSARATVAEVRQTGAIRLQEWGRIEGTFLSGGQPAEGRELLFQIDLRAVMANFQLYRVATDSEGKFSLENIPAGPGKLMKMIPSGEGRMHGDATEVFVQPGVTTYVKLGDEGGVVRGSARLQVPAPPDEPVVIEGSLSTASDEKQFSSPDEARAYFASAAGKEDVRRHKRFAIAVDAAGIWKVESVPTGRYILTLNARSKGPGQWSRSPVASAEMTVVVPDNANPASPIDVGEVLLKPGAD